MSELQTLMTGIGLGESPRWHEGRLWFSDWVAEEVIALDLEENSEVITEVHSLPFSIDWLPNGPMLITSGQKLIRMEPDGSLVTHVDLSSLSEHDWNEIVVDGRGNAYLNNIEFDLMAGEEFRPGIVALVTPEGSARQVADGVAFPNGMAPLMQWLLVPTLAQWIRASVAFPNGMAVTPDGSTLIIAESYATKLTAFDIEAEGDLTNRRVWAELDGPPDGICIDAEGAVWAGAGNRCLRIREGGEVLQAIELDRFCFACILGGPDRSTLFMMAAEFGGTEKIGKGPRTGKVLTADAPAPGAGWP